MDRNEKRKTLKYILERLYISHEIPFYVYDSEGELIVRTGNINPEVDPFGTDDHLRCELKEKSSGKELPVLSVEEDIFIYGGFLDEDGYFYVCGPAALEPPSVSRLHYYRQRHNIKEKDFYMPTKSHMALANLICMAFWGITGKSVTEEMIWSLAGKKEADQLVESKDVVNYQFENSELGTERLSWLYEQKYITAVEKGDLAYFTGGYAAESNLMSRIGKLAQDSGKQIEYMCVSSIVLVSRASIRGGLNPSVAYPLSDLYLQKLSKCRNTQEMLTLQRGMQLDFMTRVKDERESKRDKDDIEKCKDYLAQRVHQPVRIKEIADMIGINHSYLSRKFSEREGMTIAQYNIRIRLGAAANMLKYSETSIAEVADYFCFVSQSRFGSQFKKEYGITPRAYRKENRVIDFIEKD